MATIALAGWIVFAALALVGRTLLHRRRTGSTGFRGVSTAGGAAAWTAAALFGVAIAASLAAPLLDLAGTLPRWAPATGTAWRAAGLLLYGLGLALTLWAQAAMGTSWRIGVDPAERTALVTAGPFAVVRNPIFTGMAAVVAGLGLLVPNAAAAVAVAATGAGLAVHVRGVEEPYLLRTHGEAYARYASATGRFLPGLGRLQLGGFRGSVSGMGHDRGARA
jgi:protein-S-isoprenylcysteine O-methyltransferase Ste14